MATDPFPNTGSVELEQRLRILFGASGTALVVPTDPLELKDGLIWVNTSTLKLNIYFGGKVWTIGQLSAQS